MKKYVVECRKWWPTWVITWVYLPEQPDWFISWIDEHGIFKYYFKHNPEKEGASWEEIKKWFAKKDFYIREKIW